MGFKTLAQEIETRGRKGGVGPSTLYRRLPAARQAAQDEGT
jgi:hypothetical protein